MQHTFRNTPEEREECLAIARELAKEFEARGLEADQNNRFPLDTRPLFQESGLCALQVPKDQGGLGADIWTVTLVSKELAMGDPAIALAYNMHQVMVGIMRGLLEEEELSKFYRQLVDDKAVVCGGFSEERAGITGLADTTATLQADGSFVVNGKKTWGTLSEAADILTLNAAVIGDDGVPEDVLQRTATEGVFKIPMDSPGVSIKRTWDTMGMHATGTQTVLFEDAHIPADAYCGNFREGFFSHFEWVTMPFSGVYCGLADKIYTTCRDELKTKSLGATMEAQDVKLADVGFVQYKLGRMCLENEAAKRVLRATAEILLEGGDAEWNPMYRVGLLDVAKITTTETAIRMADGALRLIGGNSFRRGQIYERLFRDTRAGPFHPLTTDNCYDLLGRGELGLLVPPPMPDADGAEAAPATA